MIVRHVQTISNDPCQALAGIGPEATPGHRPGTARTWVRASFERSNIEAGIFISVTAKTQIAGQDLCLNETDFGSEQLLEDEALTVEPYTLPFRIAGLLRLETRVYDAGKALSDMQWSALHVAPTRSKKPDSVALEDKKARRRLAIGTGAARGRR